MIKNEEKIGIVSNLGMNGEGIVRCGNEVVFVPYSITGEKIRYKVLKSSSKGNFGKIIETITPADERVRAVCPVFTKCGGCQIQHIRYNNQLKFKQEKIENCFKKIAGLSVDVKPCVKSLNEFRYRNKLQLPVGQSDDELQIGFYANNSHRIVSVDDCPINSAWTKELISSLKEYMTLHNLKGYNESDCSGDVREVTAKEVNGNLIVCLVITKNCLPGVETFIEILRRKIKNKITLYLNINNNKNNVIYSDKFVKICGEESYKATMLGINYLAGLHSFSQVNNEVCEKLYSAVKKQADIDDKTVVIDAYSGAGLMTAILAKDAKRAYGIEIIEQAVKLADDLAKENKLQDKMFNILGRCENVLPDIIKKAKNNGEKITLVLDPPRKGCDIKVINSIIENDINRIVYVSCNPATLARDIALMCGTLVQRGSEIVKSDKITGKYEVVNVIPFDMFAQTKHVETLVVLSHKKPDGHISVNVEFGEEEGQVSLKDI